MRLRRLQFSTLVHKTRQTVRLGPGTWVKGWKEILKCRNSVAMALIANVRCAERTLLIEFANLNPARVFRQNTDGDPELTRATCRPGLRSRNQPNGHAKEVVNILINVSL